MTGIRKWCVLMTISFSSFTTGGSAQTSARQPSDPRYADSWKQVRQLEDDGKLNEAISVVSKILEDARTARHVEDWTQAIVRTTLLKQGVDSPETALRLLMDTPWPDDPLYGAILHVVTAHSLNQYKMAYRWEISKREKVVTDGSQDIKTWTQEQLSERLCAEYAAAWDSRDALGREPLHKWPDLITRNGYSPELRDSLRDFVAYAYASELADSANWTPRQSNELFKVDLPALIDAPARIDSNAPPHPLVRAIALLDDHLRWHESRHDRSNALEVRLERLRLLTPHLKKKALEKRIDALRRLSEEFVDVQWGSVAQYEYANALNDAGRKAEAHREADKGATMFKGSIGSRLCLNLIAGLEAPDFSMATLDPDRPGEATVRITHRNITELSFRAFKLDPETLLLKGNRWSFGPGRDQIEQAIYGQKPDAVWKVALNDPRDYADHQFDADLPMKDPGLYLIAASIDPKFSRKTNKIDTFMINLTNMTIVRTEYATDMQVLVTESDTGNPAAGVSIELYARDAKTRPMTARKTDRDGRVIIPKSDSQALILVARRGNDVALEPNLYLSGPVRETSEEQEFITTDRSIYRPGQTVYFKVLAVEGTPAGHRIRTNARLTVRLLDANNEAIATQECLTNSFGSASGTFSIPAGRLLGDYSIETENGETGLKVEEYKRPTFEVTLDAGQAELQLNREALVRGNADYYFGGNLTGGSVTWTVERRTIMPWWLNWFFRFHPISTGELRIGQGESAIDENGSFEIRFLPESDPDVENLESVQYRFAITAEVTDAAGETREGRLSVNLGHCAVQTTVLGARDLIRAGQDAEVSVTRESLDGRPMQGASDWELVRLEEPATPPMPWELEATVPEWRRTPPKDKAELPPARWTDEPGYGQRLRQFKDGERIRTGTLEHPESGRAMLNLGALEPGVYRLVSTTKDTSGRMARSQFEFIVAAEKRLYPLPVVCLAETASMKLGETAAFYVGSGFADQTLWMEITRDNRVVRRETLSSNNGLTRFDVTADETMKGGFGISVYLVRKGVLFQSSLPVFVPYHAEPLDVRFETFRDLLEPGAKETWTIRIDGMNAGKESAEILAYMFDRTLDYYTTHQYPNLGALWPQRSSALFPVIHRDRLGGNMLVRDIPIEMEYVSYAPDRLALPEIYARSNRMMAKMAPRATGQGMCAGAAMPVMEESVVVVSESPVTDVTSASVKGSADKDSSGTSRGSGKEPEIPLRENFSETAFFLPHLMTDDSGAAIITFTAPDSVTSWNLFIHALTRDLRYAVAQKTVETRKDMMVRPYLPRFLREGDRAEIPVMVNNTGATDLDGVVSLRIVDPETGADCAARFGLSPVEQPVRVSAGKSATVRFQVSAPAMLGSYTIEASARAGDHVDGERRTVPVLPGRMHLAQSRFVTLAKDQPRTMRLGDLAESASDPSLINESLVVTVDGQLVNQIIRAVPYLVEYPYECVEQTMNRFLGVGILNRIYADYPAIARAADACSSRETPFEAWREDDPNRRMALVETPWLVTARGGTASDRLINVLDRRTARRHQDKALKQLVDAQNDDGAFPWWTGGPSSPYMTLYVVYSCAKAREFGIDEPDDELVLNALTYLHTDFLGECKPKMAKQTAGVEYLVLLNYMLSCFENPERFNNLFSASEREDMLAYCFERWRQLPPQSRAHLALTLNRMNRPADAQLLMDSIMDRAVTTDDQGTFFAPEDRAWLWYNDSIETHAAVMLALMEIRPGDSRLEGLLTWIFLNKKMNQWKSTRATAEVLYAIVKYLEADRRMGIRQEAAVTAGTRSETFVFEPDDFDKTTQQWVIGGPDITPEMSAVTVSPKGGGQMFASMTWQYSTMRMPEDARGDTLSVTRTYYLREGEGDATILKPLDEGHAVSVGDQVEVHLSIRAKNPMEYIHLMDPRAAGFEPEDRVSGHQWDLGLVRYQEIRDSCTNFFIEWMPQGEYTLKYRLRASQAGEFRCGPATLQSMYAPEFTGFSSGRVIRVEPR